MEPLFLTSYALRKCSFLTSVLGRSLWTCRMTEMVFFSCNGVDIYTSHSDIQNNTLLYLPVSGARTNRWREKIALLNKAIPAIFDFSWSLPDACKCSWLNPQCEDAILCQAGVFSPGVHTPPLSFSRWRWEQSYIPMSHNKRERCFWSVCCVCLLVSLWDQKYCLVLSGDSALYCP